MNVMFITIENVKSFETRSIYMDLVNKFIEKGHYVTVLSACEKRDRNSSDSNYYSYDEKGEIFKVNTMNVTKTTNFVMKGLGLIFLLPKFRIAAMKAMKNRTYDLVFYGSPPITVYSAVKAVKKKQNAYSYLLLKDIWPYDCLFGDVLTQKGWKKIAFDYLVYLARQLYNASDTIGCMSPANIKFLTDHEPLLDINKIEVNPNSIEPFGKKLSMNNICNIRKKYNIPENKVVFVYGGSLGIPQGIDFALESVRDAQKVEDAYFVFVGAGTEFKKIEVYVEQNKLENFLLLPSMTKDEYETLVYACDVGLIYLNHECLAPNYPSRLLTYLQASIPVLCATDTYTDVGKIAFENEYGFWCESLNTDQFVKYVRQLCEQDIREYMGCNGREYLINNYTAECSYNKIIEKII